MTNLNNGGTPEKPEWFQMAEADSSMESSTASLRSSKRLPLLALLATGAILSGGAVFANVTENEVANAESATTQEFVPATQAVLGDSSTPGATTGTDTGITPPQAPANPNGIQPPRPGGGDDDDDFEDHEWSDGGDHERPLPPDGVRPPRHGHRDNHDRDDHEDHDDHDDEEDDD